MPTILFLSATSGDALRAAKKLGLRVVLAAAAVLEWQLQYVDEQIRVNPYRSEEVVRAALEYRQRSAINGVITFDERAVPVLGTLVDRLGVPGNSYESSYAARNKYVMRRRFVESGLNCPRFELVRSPDDALRAARESTGFPAVMKPLFGFMSQGVIRVDDDSSLVREFETVLDVAQSYAAFAGCDPYFDSVLIEEFLPGREIAVDGLLVNGNMQWIGTFDKPNPLDGPTFEETIYVRPSSEPQDVQAASFEAIELACRALGLRTGPVHAEVRLTPRGPYVIEVAARAIGGICARAHQYCLGLDYNKLVLQVALGDDIELPKGHATPAGVMMLPVPGVGKLLAVHGIDEAASVPGVHDVFVMAKPGDMIRAFPKQSCYLGFIVASGACNQEVVERLNKSHGLLRFDLEAPGSVSSVYS